MSPDQLALRALNRIAVFHSCLERIGLLLLPACLQSGVMLAYHQRAMLVVRLNALLAQPTSGAGGGVPFKTIANAAGGLRGQTTALSVLLSGRTNRFALLDLNLKGFTRKASVMIVWSSWGRANHPPPLCRRRY